MYINHSENGQNNICGKNIASQRIKLGISQRQLADRLQLLGLNIGKNSIQRIESGARFVTDIDLVNIAKALEMSFDELLKN